MYELVKQSLLRLLRVPHDPAAPAGSRDSLRIFRASPRLYYWNLIQWGTLQLLAAVPVMILLIGMAAGSSKLPAWIKPCAFIGVCIVGALYLMQLLLTFWMQKLDYEMRWYIVTDRSLRIRAGVWSVKEITMTFANIQKVQISQGPLQKILNIATAVVTSAGGGGGAAGAHGQAAASDRHAARFEGVENAAEIRDMILDRLRQYRDAGLGDSPTIAAVPHDGGPDREAVDAANALLDAARGLRLSLEARRS